MTEKVTEDDTIVSQKRTIIKTQTTTITTQNDESNHLPL